METLFVGLFILTVWRKSLMTDDGKCQRWKAHAENRTDVNSFENTFQTVKDKIACLNFAGENQIKFRSIYEFLKKKLKFQSFF